MTHLDYIYGLLSNFGDEDIVIYDSRTPYSKQEIRKHVIEISTHLSHLNIKSGGSIGLLCKSGFEYVCGFFAILLHGCSVTIIDPNFHNDIIARQVQVCGVSHILCDTIIYRGSRYSLSRSYIKYRYDISLHFLVDTICINISSIGQMIGILDYNNTHQHSDVCCLIPTGGTTSNPKIVAHSYHSFEQSIMRMKQLPIHGNIFLADLPYVGILALLLGKRSFFTSPFKNLATQITTITNHNIDIIFTTPNKLLGEYHIPSNIKTIILGSAPIYKSFCRDLLGRLSKNTTTIGVYGMTECLPISWYNISDKILEIEDDYLGQICNRINISINNEELCLKTGDTCIGYIDNQNTNLIQTGDIVYQQGNKLFMKGRIKNMIIKNGVNIYPSLYENLFLSTTGVKNAVLFGIFDEDKQDELCVLAIECVGSGDTQSIISNIKKISIHGDIEIDNILFCEIPTKGRQDKVDYAMLRNLYNNKQKIGK